MKKSDNQLGMFMPSIKEDSKNEHMKKTKKTLSIIIPLYNEEGSLQELVFEIQEIINNLNMTEKTEIIFIGLYHFNASKRTIFAIERS